MDGNMKQTLKEWAVAFIIPLMLFAAYWSVTTVNTQDRESQCYTEIRSFQIETRLRFVQRELGLPGGRRPVTPLSPQCIEIADGLNGGSK